MDVRRKACEREHLPKHPDGQVFFLSLKTSPQKVQRLLTVGKVEEEIEHSIPAKALCPTKSASLTYLLPVPNRKPADQGAIQEATLASTRVLSFRVENRLPANIRLNDILPPVVATLRGLDPADDDDPPYASMWGRISLMSADGRVAMAQIAPDILLGTVLTPFQPPNDGDWSLVFAGLKIRRPGYYRLHVALMQTSQRESEDGGPPIVEAPRELLGAATDLIHVHSFAPERHEWRPIAYDVSI